jgi:chromosome segregation ATPase
VASGALTADVSAEVERLRAQHADAVREKSAAESKNRRLAEKVAALEAEKTDLRRQLVEERREANQAIAEAQAAQAEAKLARAEGSLASQRAEEWEVRFNGLCSRVDKAEASTRSEVERTRAQLVDSYRELGRGLLTSRCPTERRAFASSSGCKTSRWYSRPSWKVSCPLPPSSSVKGL